MSLHFVTLLIYTTFCCLVCCILLFSMTPCMRGLRLWLFIYTSNNNKLYNRYHQVVWIRGWAIHFTLGFITKKRLNYQAQNPAFVKHQTHFSTSSITALCKIGPNCFSIDSPHKIIADMLDGKIGLKGYPTEQDLPVLG